MAETSVDPASTTDTWAVARSGVRVPGAAEAHADAREDLGRYVVLRQLGRGGMGVVLAAYDPSLDRKVAIKVLSGGLEASSEGAARMRREAQAMARLSHPNVAQVHEVGEAQGRLYLVMEYVDGVTLGDWLAARPRAMAEVLHTFMEAGRGLAAAHAAGLIHRDFKPDNAMVGADGRVRVLDFGLSRSVLAPDDADVGAGSGSQSGMTITAVGTLIGTPAYMSPEQHMRGEADARSDQFSFCVALYEALYGQRPFSGKHLKELSVRVVAGVIGDAPPETRVPAWLRQVLLRGLKVDPAARWPNMDALLAALARDPQRTRRRWLLAGLGVVAVAGASYGAATWRIAQAQMCSGAIDELRGAWDPPRRAALEQAVHATGSAYAGSLLASVTARLDGHAERWAASHTAACEAHRRGHASAQLFDRKMQCLRQRRTDLAATVDVLTQTTAASVANLVEAAVLPSITSCEDDARLLADVPPPADPEVAVAVERARGRLARLQALERAGRFGEALTELASELVATRQLGDVALLAETHLLAGKLHMHRAQGEARADLDLALQLALEARLDAVAAEALTVEIFQIGNVERRSAEARMLVPLAWALVRRVGSPVQLTALLHNNIASVHSSLGEYLREVESLERGLELLDPQEDDPLRWVLVHNLAQALITVGEFARARAVGEPVLARLEQLYGRCHPIAASLRSNCAAVDREQGRFAAAIAVYEAAALCASAGDPLLGLYSLKDLTTTALLQGDDAAARAYIARADALVAAAPGVRPHLVELALARAELATRSGDLEAARELLAAEQARVLANQGAAHPNLGVIATRLAIVAHRQGDDAAALVHLQRAAELLPDYWSAEQGRWAFTQAQVLRALGRENPQVLALVARAIAAYRREGAAHTPRIAEIEAWVAGSP